MVNLVNAYRSILMYGTPPDWLPLLLTAGLTLVLLPIGHQIFKRQSARFVEEL